MLKPMNNRLLVAVNSESETVTSTGLTIINDKEIGRVRSGVVSSSDNLPELVGKIVFYDYEKSLEINHGEESVAVIEEKDILAVVEG